MNPASEQARSGMSRAITIITTTVSRKNGYEKNAESIGAGTEKNAPRAADI